MAMGHFIATASPHHHHCWRPDPREARGVFASAVAAGAGREELKRGIRSWADGRRGPTLRKPRPAELRQALPGRAAPAKPCSRLACANCGAAGGLAPPGFISSTVRATLPSRVLPNPPGRCQRSPLVRKRAIFRTAASPRAAAHKPRRQPTGRQLLRGQAHAASCCTANSLALYLRRRSSSACRPGSGPKRQTSVRSHPSSPSARASASGS